MKFVLDEIQTLTYFNWTYILKYLELPVLGEILSDYFVYNKKRSLVKR